MPRCRLRWYVPVVIAALAAAMTGPLARGEGRRLALVVGADSYRQSSGLPPLRYAGRDAQQLGAALRDSGYTVFEMTHAAARVPGKETFAPNADYIRDQLDGMLGYPNLGAGDAVIVTFHGHGVQFDEQGSGGARKPRFYFCPADAKIDDVATTKDLSDRNHLLPLDEVYQELAGCGAATRILIVDACRNDPTRPTLFRSGLASATLPKLPPPPGGIVEFFSCKPNERSLEDPNLRHGVFTHFLIKGLRGKADLPTATGGADGLVTLGELSTYVANNTYAHVYQNHRVRQSPVLRGDFELGLPLGRVVIEERPAGEQRRDNGLAMPLVWCPPTGPEGFLMGSPDSERWADDEKPRHSVVLTKGFWLGKYEVTQAEWERLMGTRPWEGRDLVLDSPRAPATCVSWDEVEAFCKRLTEQERRAGRLPPSGRYTLPTEAQWEYACRAGSTTRWSFGDSDYRLGRYAISGAWAPTERVINAHEVGTRAPNPWGFHDMHGNVTEWCLDWYGAEEYRAGLRVDPTGPLDGVSRVVRGGRWGYGADSTRSAARDREQPYFRFKPDNVGFRILGTE